MSAPPVAPLTREPAVPRRAALRLPRLGTVVLTVVLLIFTGLVLIPFAWMIDMSLRTTGAILTNPYGLPSTLDLRNYVRLFFDPEIAFYRYYYNSIFVTFFALVLVCLLSTLAGYGFGRAHYDFKFRGWLFAILLFGIVLPPQIMYIPQFTLMARYHLINSRWSLVLLYAALGLPVSVYLMSTYFSQLPSEMEDAARMDGCSDWRLFWQIMLPLARPALSTVILVNSLTFWNELLLSVTMVTDPALRTLPAAMFNFVGENAADYGMAATSLVSAMLPLLILYIVLSERFIEGLTAGALKG